MRSFLLATLIGLAACSSQPAEPTPAALKMQNLPKDSVYLFPSCLKQMTIREASEFCEKKGYDWYVDRLQGTYDGDLGNFQHRKEGVVSLFIKDGLVTDANCHWYSLENVRFGHSESQK